MQVNYNNKNTQAPNFQSIRIVKANTHEFTGFVKNFPNFCKKNLVFKGESFLHSTMYDILNSSTKHGESIDWVYKNAENHGLLNISALQDLPMYVFTGFDKLKLNIMMLKNTIALSIKCTKNTIKLLKSDFPEHLIVAKNIKDFADAKLPSFNRFVERNNGKDMNFADFIEELKQNNIKS